jgi:hypothetical protein
MTLKEARLGRAEDMSEEDRADNGLPERGLILIATTNPTLKDRAILINTDDENGGIRGYLLGLGEFNDIAINESD